MDPSRKGFVVLGSSQEVTTVVFLPKNCGKHGILKQFKFQTYSCTCSVTFVKTVIEQTLYVDSIFIFEHGHAKSATSVNLSSSGSSSLSKFRVRSEWIVRVGVSTSAVDVKIFAEAMLQVRGGNQARIR